MTKFSEAFAIIGGLGGGISGAVRGGSTPLTGFIKGSRNGMIIGLPVGALAVYGRMSSLQKVRCQILIGNLFVADNSQVFTWNSANPLDGQHFAIIL